MEDRVQKHVALAGVQNAALFSDMKRTTFNRYKDDYYDANGQAGVYSVLVSAVTQFVPLREKTLLHRVCTAVSETLWTTREKAHCGIADYVMIKITEWREIAQESESDFIKLLKELDEEKQIDHEEKYLRKQIAIGLNKRPHHLVEWHTGCSGDVRMNIRDRQSRKAGQN